MNNNITKTKIWKIRVNIEYNLKFIFQKEEIQDIAWVPPAKEEDSLIADMYHKAIKENEEDNDEIPTDVSDETEESEG